jgi:predicted RNase H-like HicB family nuclease
MSKEEYEIRMEEYWKKYHEQQKGKRDLPIPGVISDDAMGWTALMTAQEIYELIENYKELAISDYREPVPGNSILNHQHFVFAVGQCSVI